MMNTQTKPLQDNSWSAHYRASLVLGLPLIGTQLAQMGINFIDLVMLGWLGAETLAASVLATTIFFIVLVAGFGLSSAVMPLVARAAGEDDVRSMRRAVRMGLWVVMVFSLLMMPILWNTENILLLMGQEPDLASAAQGYVRIAQWSLFPVLFVSTLRSYLSAQERMQIILLITLMAVGVNAFLNYALIFGNFGMPRMELQGAALATTITNFITAIVLTIYCMRVPAIREHEIFVRFWQPDWVAFFDVLRLGTPIALTILAEVGLFSAASIMMGWVGTIELAAHGIALQVASISFMIPLSFSQVGTVRLGRAIGRKDRLGMDRAGTAVFVLGLGFALFAAICFILFPTVFIGVYLDKSNPEADLILAYGVPLLALAAAFQIGDSLQVLASGMLRAFKDTTIPMYIAIFSYWAVGAPIMYFMAFKFGYGGQGIWSGLAFGLTVAAILMCWRYYRRDAIGLVEI